MSKWNIGSQETERFFFSSMTPEQQRFFISCYVNSSIPIEGTYRSISLRATKKRLKEIFEEVHPELLSVCVDYDRDEWEYRFEKSSAERIEILLASKKR